MLTDLVQTIETLQQRIRSRGTFIGDYESRTRVALIDPMLRALGWDVSDPGLVHIEPRTANGWADYALLGGDERPVVFVEAKKLAERDIPIQQTVGYAVTENIQHRSNVRYCASTNGDRWEVYDIRAQESVMSVSLSREDAPKCALKLLGLWRDSLLSDGNVDIPVAPVVSAELLSVAPAPRQSATVVPRIAPPTPSVDVASAPPAPGTAGWVPLGNNFEVTNRPPPSEVQFPGRSAVAVRSWRGMFVEIALWLHEQGLLTRQNCQVPRGRNRVMFSTNGMHPNGEPFRNPVQIESVGLVLEGHMSGKACVRLAKDLLAHFGQDPVQVHLRLTG